MNPNFVRQVLTSCVFRRICVQNVSADIYRPHKKWFHMCLQTTVISRHDSMPISTSSFFKNYLHKCKLTSFCRQIYTHQISKQSHAESSKSKNETFGLADELLAAKVQPAGTEKSSGEEEAESQKDQDKERTIRALKFTTYFLSIMLCFTGGFTIWSWGAPTIDDEGNEVEDEFSKMPVLQQYVYRTFSEAKNMNRMIQEPTRDQLLPDPLKPPYIQPPYTLVLELKDVLVHPEWTYQTGWRFKKRPGVDFLLQHCAPPLFEIVIYTNEQGFTANPVIEQLDPNGFIWYKLYKDCTRYEEGKHLKDLYCLNRDLKKVIAIDWDKDSNTVARNQLSLKRWDGNMNDQTLVDLAMMLRTIAESEVSDVREVLDYYRTFDDPIEAFRENQRAAQLQEAEIQKNISESAQNRRLLSGWGGSFLTKRQ